MPTLHEAVAILIGPDNFDSTAVVQALQHVLVERPAYDRPSSRTRFHDFACTLSVCGQRLFWRNGQSDGE